MTAAESVIESLTEDQVRLARLAIEHYYDRGYGDGLPVVPPTRSIVDEFLAQTPRDPQEELTSHYNVHRGCSVEQAAICSVMAGCKPEYFPIVVAALDALQSTDGWRSAGLQSTTGGAQLLLINGPVREKFGFNSKQAVWGPGFRANSTISRAIRLVVLDVFGIRPGEFDQATQSSPARYGFCIAENEEDSPWEPYHVEKGFAPDANTVTVMGGRSVLHVEQRHSAEPEVILSTIGDSMAYGGGFDPGHRIETSPPGNERGLVVMGPEHANDIAARGWSKQDAKRGLWERYGRTAGELRRCGKGHGLEDRPDDEFIRFAKSPDSITILVAGAYNCGISSVVMGGGGVTREIVWA
jgi:hypothetical protein